MSHIRNAVLMLLILILSSAAAQAATSITIGKGDFYISVGDYDYLPYGPYDRLPRVSFYEMMSDYGTWVTVSPFGRAWRPYVYYDWQPFTYGRWIYTRYGPTWQGYEPWAWVAYHYGNWIWSQYYGWVWVPGYEWHPGRVIWSHTYGSIGWMPAPPSGYNYFCGYLCPERYTYGSGPVYPYRTSDDYYSFEDYDDFDDFSEYEEYDEYLEDDDNYYDDYYDNDRYEDNRYGSSRYPGEFYDRYYSYGFRYDPYFFNTSYLKIAPRLWVFIATQNFGYDDYSDLYFDADYVRYLFDRRYLQFNRRGLDRIALERIVRQRINEHPVQIKQMETERQVVRVVVPQNTEEKIRRHANRVVKEVIAPAFVEKRKAFKGERARNREVVTRVFKEPRAVRKQDEAVETLNEEDLLNEAKQKREERRAKRQRVVKEEIRNIEKADREGKLETLKRSRTEAEKKEKARSRQSEKRSDNNVRNRSDREQRKVEPAVKLERWKKRETAKFNSWKKRQQREFERWKENHKDNPQRIEKAEREFEQRMRRAEDQFQQRTKQAEQKSRRSR